MSTSGGTPLAALFEKFAAQAGTVQETAFPAIVEDFRDMAKRRWANNGPGWAPLSPATIDIETRLGYPDPHRIMYGHGDLMNSLTGQTKDSIVRIGPDELFMGTSIHYAQYHQQGPRQIRVFGKGSAKLPERPVVEVKEEDAIRWCALIRAAVLRRR